MENLFFCKYGFVQKNISFPRRIPQPVIRHIAKRTQKTASPQASPILGAWTRKRGRGRLRTGSSSRFAPNQSQLEIYHLDGLPGHSHGAHICPNEQHPPLDYNMAATLFLRDSYPSRLLKELLSFEAHSRDFYPFLKAFLRDCYPFSTPFLIILQGFLKGLLSFEALSRDFYSFLKAFLRDAYLCSVLGLLKGFLSFV